MSMTQAGISKIVSTYVDVEVDIELDEIDESDMAQHLRGLGYTVAGKEDPLDPTTFEYRIWEALRMARTDDLRRLLADMIFERIGRIV